MLSITTYLPNLNVRIYAQILAAKPHPPDPLLYQPLPAGQAYIRLVSLLPHSQPSSPIKCRLFQYSLERGDGSHLYEALSYVWGDPNETISIIVNDQRLNITTNLHAALIQFRDPTFARLFWIDAICINQTDLEERSSQVQYMAQIYASASRVNVWLGPSVRGSTNAFRFIESHAGVPNKTDQPWECWRCGSWTSSDESLCSDCNSERQQHYWDFESVKLLSQRPWFERIWVCMLLK
jgi:hypothetical protein